MRIKSSVLAALSGLSLAALSAPALAGGCGIGSGPCDVGVQVMPSVAPSFDPVTVYNNNPMSYLRTVHFKRAPHVSITRVHGMAPTASLADAPSGFTNGCHPSSTQYCRATAGGSQVSAAQFSQPVITAAPTTTTTYVSPPVTSAPVMRSWTASGYDASKLQPRQYGDNTFTPGIAHIPTSIVDRSPVHAQAILNSGRTVPQRVVSGASLPQPSVPLSAGNGLYGSNVASDGTYWEKASGPKVMGSTIATQVICKRQLPRQVVNPVVQVPVPVPTRVVNPIVRVPVGVPTPVAVNVQAPSCLPAQRAARSALAGAHTQARYGASQGGWVY